VTHGPLILGQVLKLMPRAPIESLEFISLYDILGLQRKEATAMGT
jgi:hypothetical protein